MINFLITEMTAFNFGAWDISIVITHVKLQMRPENLLFSIEIVAVLIMIVHFAFGICDRIFQYCLTEVL